MRQGAGTIPHPIRGLAAFVVVAALAGEARADEAVFAVAGAFVGTDRSVTIPVAEGHDLVVFRVDYGSGGFEGAYSPLNGAGGPCFGAMDLEGAEAEGSGYCTWTDPDGNLAVMEWRAAARGEGGAVAGDWAARGGTGKWAGAAGGGAFEATAPGAAPEATLTLRGTLTLR